jgi:hypothetical protein
LTLIDNASSEYLFIYEFFSRDLKTAADTAKIMFQFIFESTEKVGMVKKKKKMIISETEDITKDELFL